MAVETTAPVQHLHTRVLRIAVLALAQLALSYAALDHTVVEPRANTIVPEVMAEPTSDTPRLVELCTAQPNGGRAISLDVDGEIEPVELPIFVAGNSV